MKIQDRTAGFDRLRRDLEADQRAQLDSEDDWVQTPKEFLITRADRWGALIILASICLIGFAELRGLYDIAIWLISRLT
jgi:hypothetical protein